MLRTLAVAHEAVSIAFPAISTGVCGYPIVPAIDVAVDTVTGFLDQTATRIDQVVFCCFGSEAYEVCCSTLLAHQR